jgi:hypothetical protein
MGSLVPSFSLSRLLAVFGASWNWTNRPAYQIKIRHQFELGGFDVEAGRSIDLDPMGLEWMRTLELSLRWRSGKPTTSPTNSAKSRFSGFLAVCDHRRGDRMAVREAGVTG